MTASPARGIENWRARLACDICDRAASRQTAIVVWNAAVPSPPAARHGIKYADVIYCCGWACADQVRDQNPGWKMRTSTFADFLRPLVEGLLPKLVDDPAAEARIRIELVLSSQAGKWVPLKTLHGRVPPYVRSGGGWNSALSQLAAEGRLQVRRTRDNPKARPRTEFLYVANADAANMN
jgi:hypothetical protein